VYPTIAIYRDATGAPGWVAASTLGNVIRLQPISTLQRTHALDSTLRHEFLHLLIESQARPAHRSGFAKDWRSIFRIQIR